MNKIIGLITIIFLLTCPISCQKDAGKSQCDGDVAQVIRGRAIPKRISIYRYGNFPMSKAKDLESSLKKCFPQVELKVKVLAFPSKHYYKAGNRYRATGLLDDLGRYRNGDAVLGLTDYIIFTSNEKSKTWGIMGLSYVGAYKSVISSVIPKSGKQQTADNFCKLALHELGHGFGLNHCNTPRCFMIDAEGGMKFDKTPAFCNSCKSYLNAKGWTIP